MRNTQPGERHAVRVQRAFELSTLCLIWGAVTVGLATVIFTLTVKETNGIDLETVTAD